MVAEKIEAVISKVAEAPVVYDGSNGTLVSSGDEWLPVISLVGGIFLAFVLIVFSVYILMPRDRGGNGGS